MRAVLIAVVAVFALAGCASTQPTRTAPELPATSGVAPQALTYPDIGIDQAPLDPTGLTDSGELAVPPLDRPEEIVYANWANPLANRMPTVLASHVNGRAADGTAIPGGFARLAEAEPGDELTVTHADGTTTTYTVRNVDTVDKDTFPTAQVFSDGPDGRLVLVTCGGEIDHEARSYESNVLVFAEATR